MTDPPPQLGDCRCTEGDLPGFYTNWEIFDGERWRPLTPPSSSQPGTPAPGSLPHR